MYPGAIRKSSPVIVGSLLLMVTALTFSILGNSKRDARTLIAAILYVCSGQYHNTTRQPALAALQLGSGRARSSVGAQPVPSPTQEVHAPIPGADSDYHPFGVGAVTMGVL